jgi:hypothetical protein
MRKTAGMPVSVKRDDGIGIFLRRGEHTTGAETLADELHRRLAVRARDNGGI